MTTFAPSHTAGPELAENPHHNHNHLHLHHQQQQQLSPPPPFAHQLSSATPPFSPLHANNHNHNHNHNHNPSRLAHRPSADLRRSSVNGSMAGANSNANANANANANGPMAVPGGPHARIANGQGQGHGHGANVRGMAFEGPRSPPNNKSTSHVPCKFYRQGACQAGKACPFLHSDEPLTERAPCKYFTKGNCKFGPKCALAHILPNGHVVNRNNVGHFGRVNLPQHHEPAPGSSLLTMQAHMAPMQPSYPYPMQEDFFGQKQQYDMIPTIDTTFSSHHAPNYGSPPNENGRMPISPAHNKLTVMDVQLPASFDSQGVSHSARYGPFAASVPSKFLAQSPPASFQGDSPALRNLHESVYGDGTRGRAAALGSSPPESIEQPVGRRIMHSELGSRSKGIISASVGARPPMGLGDEWDDTDLLGRFEEEMLPANLSELFTPQERMRRSSRDHGDNDGNWLSHRNSVTRLGASPSASEVKIGSPSGVASSPSRFQSLWGKSRPTQEAGFESGSLPGASAFGHVGSPLRNSTLHPGASPSLRAMARPTNDYSNPFISSPPRQATMSIISQQMSRTRLSSRASEDATPTSNPMHPGVTRVTSGSSIGSSPGRLGMDRAVSSSSINRERIEEEQGLFSMEEEEELERGKGKDGASTTSSNSNKRLSGLSWGSGGKGSPSLAPIGGHRTAGNPSGLGRESGPWGSNA